MAEQSTTRTATKTELEKYIEKIISESSKQMPLSKKEMKKLNQKMGFYCSNKPFMI